MPIYEFVCKTCKQPFEKLIRSASSAPAVTCPTCGSADVQKALSLFATKPQTSSSGAFDYAASACAPGGT
ncbi:zinc ribbon domain-containing protein [Anaerolineae bacterium CFX7]|nr:zinc ribbon domain-containing protein [Anaerolineae bacterium CFX7]